MGVTSSLFVTFQEYGPHIVGRLTTLVTAESVHLKTSAGSLILYVRAGDGNLVASIVRTS